MRRVKFFYALKISMAYREAAEIPGMHWKKAFTDFYAGRQEMMASGFLDSLDSTDKFIPAALGQLTDTDLPALLRVATRLEQTAQQNSYNYFFVHLVNKAITLVLENFPEAYNGLSPAEKEKVLGIKIELPDEEAIFSQVYAYTQGREEMPFATLNTGATLESVLAQVKKESETQKDPASKPLEQRVVDSLSKMDSQYNLHFLQEKPLV